MQFRRRPALVHDEAKNISGVLASGDKGRGNGGDGGDCRVGDPSAERPMPYKFNESRRHKIPKARYRVTNWPAYDAALIQRASITLWFTEEAVEALYAQATGERGAQPVYSAIAVETSLAFGWYFISRCVKPKVCCARSPRCSMSISESPIIQL